MIARTVRHSAPLLPLVLSLGALGAQCKTEWIPSDGILGANSNVYAAARWDPDGAGPLGTHLVVGGEFSILGDAVGNPAMFDPVTRHWSPLPGLQASWIRSFCTLPTGELVAGGLIGAPGMLARWNGASWGPIAPSLQQSVRKVVACGPDLVASTYYSVYGIDVATGALTTIVQQSTEALLERPGREVLIGTSTSVQRWDGSSLQSIGSTNGAVTTLTAAPNGDVIASGAFTMIGGTAAAFLARWDGSAWHAVAPGLSTSVIAEPMPDGSIVVSGFFSSIGSTAVNHIARWNGTQWLPLGAGLNGLAAGLVALPSGDLFAIGNGFNTAGGAATRKIAHYDGAAWQRVGGINPDSRMVDAAQLPDGDVVAVGYFQSVGDDPAQKVARRHQGVWTPMGSLTMTPMDVLCGPSGRVFVGGYYDVALWNGSQWASTNLAPNANGYVRALAELANGDVVAGGTFTSTNGTPAARIARWNGATWSGMGAGLPQTVTSILQLPDGSVVASAGHVYRWDGATWSQLGSIKAPTSVIGAENLALHPDGSLWAAGQLALGVVARWNGTSWVASAGHPNHAAEHLAILSDGDVVVFGNSPVYPHPPIGSRWNGLSWTTLPFACKQLPVGGEDLENVVWLSRGELMVLGYFNTVNGQVAPWHASLGTSCPAMVTEYGQGCSSSVGPVELHVVEPAWVGGSLRTVATGIPNGAFAIGIGGLGPDQVPLPAILPTGQAGCELLTTVDALYLLLPNSGAASAAIAIPNAPLYLSKQFFHQVVVLEFDAAGQFGAVTSSNAVEVRVGAF